MDIFKPTAEELRICMKDPSCIRNVCILAHVDHGKTTVADLLLATNRLVSKRMAGQLRYLDDRPDEQERGITMKSSAVSLLNIIHDENTKVRRKILLNLIDTPGHIDFSSEVGAAIRVCDAALILVDVVEGVCVQTRESISKAFEEHAKMILVVNKLDRLILELDKDIDLMFQSIIKVIEDCNVIIAELYQYEFMSNEVDIEDTGLLFNPDKDNVIFASAIDGWAFTTRQISKMFVDMIKNETVDSLNVKMWNFDCWVDSKGEINQGAVDRQKPNLFIQLCLKTIVHVYQSIIVRMEKDKIPSILKKLKIENPTREMTTSNDSKAQIKAILSAWKPLAYTVLSQCLNIIPAPSNLDKSKIEYLLNANHYIEDPFLYKCVQEVVPYFQDISVTENTPTIAYVSKMFCVNTKNLSQNAPKQFVPKPRPLGLPIQQLDNLSLTDKPEVNTESEETIKEQSLEDKIKEVSGEIAVIALARIFSGTLRVGQEIFAMSPGYIPNEDFSNEACFLSSNRYINKVQIKELYMLFGRELVLVDSVPAGNFCGIGGIESKVLRTATLSTTLKLVPLVEHPTSSPVVRYAVEPINPKELPILRHGLKLLMHSDSCVQVIMQETGELVIVTAGDVHLEKCIEDLKNKFAKIDIQVSSPMVSLRETIDNPLTELSQPIDFESSNIFLSILAVSLPQDIVDVIKNNHEFLTTVEQHQHKSLIDLIKGFNENVNDEKKELKEKIFKSEVTNRGIVHVKEQLKSAFLSCGPVWKNMANKIWSISILNDCVNLLLNDTSDYIQNIFLETNFYDKRTLLAQCIINPFHNFCKAGLICEEPLMNCAFIVKKFKLVKNINPQEINPQTVSLEESSVKSFMKTCFEKHEQRLMEPMYTTDIQVNTSILGKVYSVINRRHGKVLEAVGMDEKEKSFLVQAQIPVIESEGFVNEIRKTTSGQANPSLRFSHYEIIDGDPLVEPIEDEDASDDEFESKIEQAQRANKLRRDVRRRKGLHVEDEVVVHAEKQRTNKKK
ncbi:elongation factor-like GTPase 1 [Sitophilus oryzae]|uniref:Elongation factor-like GTPase 1 n=1 Tax=Sitophilus oryzae TaxID=7048 RepID=A0A6J2XB20_SITOR|nr:elongation factor-like GTPase 1 [Sitophilus oryzae]